MTTTRRSFMRTTAAAATATGLTAALTAGRTPQGQGSDELKIGLIGCGGRGSGAISQALKTKGATRLVAIADMFVDRLEECVTNLAEDEALKGRIEVPKQRRFVGADAYQGVFASDCDVVVIATPPHFRPQHFEAAIAAKKNVFFEKPVAVDSPGVRRVLAAAEKAQQLGLVVCCGLQRHHSNGYLEIMKQIHGGALGRILFARCSWNQGGLWHKDRQPQWSDMEWQLRNWLYFTWLSGDHIVEQHVHNIDVGRWAMGDKVPVRVFGVGGRQARTAPEYGHIFDHFGLDYEFDNGVHMLSMCRQQPGTPGLVAESLKGTKGSCDTQDGRGYEINGPSAWKWSGEYTNPYQQEHTDLIASIRAGKPLNELRQVADSTLAAIAGREAAYTGKVISLEQFLASPVSIVPTKLEFGPIPVPAVPVPGNSQTM